MAKHLDRGLVLLPWKPDVEEQQQSSLQVLTTPLDQHIADQSPAPYSDMEIEDHQQNELYVSMHDPELGYSARNVAGQFERQTSLATMMRNYNERFPSPGRTLSKKPGKKIEDRPEDEMVEVFCQGHNGPVEFHMKKLSEASDILNNKIVRAIHAMPEGPIQVRVEHSWNGLEVLKRWLYGGPVYQEDRTLGRGEELRTLMEAYAAGQLLSTSEFEDRVIDAIIELLVKHGNNLPISAVIPQKKRALPSKSSKLRQLLVDWIAYGDINESRSNEEQLPTEAHFDHLLAMAFVKRKVKGAPQPPYEANPCDYHVHHRTKRCSPKEKKFSTKY